MSNRVYIFDTTLRDGEQSPGVSLNAWEKLEIAKQLARLGVDIIEAGFPISSQGDFEAVKNIACQVRGVTIAGLARTNFNDIDRAWEAVRYAEQARIHTFIATSDIHLKHKLRMTREQVLEAAASAVKRAKGYTADVEFSTEDGFRSDLLYLCQVVETAIAAGATTINIPDTVGYATPGEYAEFIGQVISRVKGAEKAVFSVHCHDDLGMAVANSLAAVLAGARQVEGAINGIGERAGNASIEEIAMALHTRKDLFGLTTGIDTREIYRTSRLVSRLSGMEIQPNKAVVGRNAFAHESGIHQDGVLKERTTYEIMNPAMVGLTSNNLVLGKLSGRHAFKDRLIELGYQLNDEELNTAFTRFKELADRKKEINNQDIEAIVENEIRKVPAVYELSYLHINSGTTLIPTATLALTMTGEDTDPVKKENASCGNGPVDAICKAVDSITGYSCRLIEWGINAIGSGQDALGEVTLRISENGSEDQYMGRGISTDVLEASAKAYVDAINKMIYGKNKR